MTHGKMGCARCVHSASCTRMLHKTRNTCLVAGLLLSKGAHAADTTEPFDPGLSDLEVYFHVGPAPSGATGLETISDLVVGYGVNERVSCAFGTSLENVARARTGSVAAGMFANLMDTAHVDLDVYGGAWLPLDGSRTVETVGGVEINLDLAPDLEVAGLYARLEWPMLLQARGAGEPPAVSSPPRMDYLVGAYVTLEERHQLLLELPAGLSLEHGIMQPVLPGEVAIGYNVALGPSVELISQVTLDWRARTDQSSSIVTGLMLGTIVTL